MPKKRSIAVIPARGGSKRIPRKNILLFDDRPMISYAIEAAVKSDLFDAVFVSTDDDEIADTALLSGASVPFKRPLELSDDLTPTVPVIKHAIKNCGIPTSDFDFTCCIYACVPFLTASDLIKAYEIFAEAKAPYAYPVTKYTHPTQRAITIDRFNRPKFLYPEYEMVRTQDLEETYHDCGQFYWGKNDAWLAEMPMHSSGIAVEFPSWRFIDIDTHDDWKRAEAFKHLQLSHESSDL